MNTTAVGAAVDVVHEDALWCHWIQLPHCRPECLVAVREPMSGTQWSAISSHNVITQSTSGHVTDEFASYLTAQYMSLAALHASGGVHKDCVLHKQPFECAFVR